MSLVLVKKIAKRVVKFLAILFVALFILVRLLHIDSLRFRHTLKYVVQHADEVHFHRYQLTMSPDNPSIKEKVLTGDGAGFFDTSTGEYRRMLDYLRASNDFHRAPKGTPGNITAILILHEYNDYSPRMYEYLPDTGEIGSGDEWCTVPPELKNWIAQQLALSEKQTADSQSQTSH